MRTSIELPDPLLRRAKEVAERRGTTLRSLVEEALRRYLAEAKPSRFRLREVAFRGHGLAPGLDWGNWEEIRGRVYEGRGG